MATCDYCARELDSRNLQPHLRSCPDNPVVREAIKQALADPNCPGFACSTRAYIHRRVFYGAPSADVLIIKYRTWETVCAEFGLLAPVSRDGTASGARAHPFANCPHCGLQYRSSALGNHERTCPRREDLRAAIIAVAEHPDLPGVAVPANVYTERRQGQDVPSQNALERHFGTWHKAMAYYGLATMRNQEEVEQRVMADVAAERRRVQQVLREEREGAYGLAVAKVLDAPHLRINGKECVRYEIR